MEITFKNHGGCGRRPRLSSNTEMSSERQSLAFGLLQLVLIKVPNC